MLAYTAEPWQPRLLPALDSLPGCSFNTTTTRIYIFIMTPSGRSHDVSTCTSWPPLGVIGESMRCCAPPGAENYFGEASTCQPSQLRAKHQPFAKIPTSPSANAIRHLHIFNMQFLPPVGFLFILAPSSIASIASLSQPSRTTAHHAS